MNRPAGSLSPLSFGRRAPSAMAAAAAPRPLAISADMKLFAGAYAAGFLIVSLFIA